MKPNELRIGNWILTSLPGGNKGIMIPSVQTQVQGITLFKEVIVCHTPQIDGFSMPIKHTMGIPLTEEWLLKFGFEQYVMSYYRKGEFHITYANTGLHEYMFRDYPVLISTVHQLQNLFYALTGEELTIKDLTL